MTLLYQPKGRASEYAPWALNYYKGCEHRCVYCFAAGMAARFGQCKSRAEFHEHPTVKKTFSLSKLAREAQSKAALIDSRVLLSFTSDPYQAIDFYKQLTLNSVRVLHDYDINVQILTKNPADAYMDRDIYTPQDAIAATLTFSQCEFERSRMWEPGAPPPLSRYQGLEQFHALGIPTWASLEPVIDPASTLRIIEETRGFVDHYKIGKINYIEQLPDGYTVNVTDEQWREFTREAMSLLDRLCYTRTDANHPQKKTYYIKNSLARL